MTPHAAMPPSLPPAAEAAERIARWLQSGPAQIESGVHAGAVAGNLDVSGRPHYVYPEITGYYLQWLAWRARTMSGHAALRQRAQAAQTWLVRWARAERPPTRVYLDGQHEDWRNRTLFTFDLAMVLRGVGSAAQEGLIEADRSVVENVSRHLATLTGSDGLFGACLEVPGSPLPLGWSTTRGPYLAKAAAGILHAAEALGWIPRDVQRAASATLHAALDWMRVRPHPEMHPLLYAYEGLLSAHRDAAWWRGEESLAQGLRDVIDRANDEPLRERGDHGPARVDILGQALRAAELLSRMSARTEHWPLASLRARLIACVDAAGAVPFALDGDPAVRNVWAAMFASQALVGMAPGPCAPGTPAPDPLLV